MSNSEYSIINGSEITNNEYSLVYIIDHSRFSVNICFYLFIKVVNICYCLTNNE